MWLWNGILGLWSGWGVSTGWAGYSHLSCHCQCLCMLACLQCTARTPSPQKHMWGVGAGGQKGREYNEGGESTFSRGKQSEGALRAAGMERSCLKRGMLSLSQPPVIFADLRFDACMSRTEEGTCWALSVHDSTRSMCMHEWWHSWNWIQLKLPRSSFSAFSSTLTSVVLAGMEGCSVSMASLYASLCSSWSRWEAPALQPLSSEAFLILNRLNAVSREAATLFQPLCTWHGTKCLPHSEPYMHSLCGADDLLELRDARAACSHGLSVGRDNSINVHLQALSPSAWYAFFVFPFHVSVMLVEWFLFVPWSTVYQDSFSMKFCESSLWAWLLGCVSALSFTLFKCNFWWFCGHRFRVFWRGCLLGEW